MPLLDISEASDVQKKKILHYAADVRKFEIERFWQRSLFFWGFIGAAFVAYAQLYEEKEKLLPLIIACFGLVCSVAWTLQNRGSKYWQEAWEQKVKVVEFEVLGARLFSNWEPIEQKGLWGAARFSVSRMAIALSDFTSLIWVVLIAEAFPTLTPPAANIGLAVGFVFFTVMYLFILFICGTSKQSDASQ